MMSTAAPTTMAESTTPSEVSKPLEQITAGRVTEAMRFDEKVWALTARIPAGAVSTYGEIAAALGSPNAARAVGQALHRNPHAPAVPCHRVVAASGHLNGYAGGLARKAALLRAEGLAVTGDRVDLSECRWAFGA